MTTEHRRIRHLYIEAVSQLAELQRQRESIDSVIEIGEESLLILAEYLRGQGDELDLC